MDAAPTIRWVAQLAPTDTGALAALRLIPGLHVLEDAGSVWLSGNQEDDLAASWFACLPCLARYRCDASRRLIPLGKRVPATRLPEGDWQPISRYADPDVTTPAMPGQLVRRCRIRLRPALRAHSAEAMVTTCEALARWGETASAVRLAPLRFALREDGRALVLGTPLPPIPGNEYTRHGAALLPAGWEFDPPALLHVVPGMLMLGQGDLALFQPDGGAEQVRAGDLVPLRRSALRATAETKQ